jgi:16S rRNA G966 N2-methylase RsmD
MAPGNEDRLSMMAKKADKKTRGVAQVRALYAQPLPSSRSGALYNAFSYPTKISPEAIAVFIATHTRPGATVLDVFGGSGTTGLAAMLCDKPTDAMRAIAEKFGVAPEWGPRNAVVYELSTIGAFVAKTMSSPPAPAVFELAARDLLAKATERVGWLYNASAPGGGSGTLRHAIWSDVLECAHCRAETSYWDAAVRRKPLKLADSFKCGSCGKTVSIAQCQRAIETADDRVLGKKVERKKRVLARVFGKGPGGNWDRAPVGADLDVAAKAAKSGLPAGAPCEKLFWGDLYRSGYHKGISHLHQLYTPRNFQAIAALWELAGTYEPGVRDALQLLVLSYNASHATLMTRVVVKEGQSDFILTGAQSGVLYVSGLPVEKNVLSGIERKIGSMSRAFAAVHGSNSRVSVYNESSERLKVPTASVDYVFTDPPFGDYIPYSEINQVNELWLGGTTDRASEIIVSQAQGKGVSDYGRMMGGVFSEVARVLAPGGIASVVFHSAKPEVWAAFTQAYASAGFKVEAASFLDKSQSSFKQVVSDVSVKGDPLLLLSKDTKPSKAARRPTASSIAAEVLSAGSAHPERNDRELFSRFVGRCLEDGVVMSIGAREFRDLVKVKKKTNACHRP